MEEAEVGKVKPVLDLIRGVVRPFVTAGTLTAAIVMVFVGVPVPDWLKDILLVAVGFWFGARQVSNGNGIHKPPVG